jgi:hypothetical protein
MLGVLLPGAFAMIAPARQALEYGDSKLELGLPLCDLDRGACGHRRLRADGGGMGAASLRTRIAGALT